MLQSIEQDAEMKSILQDRETGCLVCGYPYTEEHHVLYGMGNNRMLSEKYGLKVYLCAEHHRGNTGVHFNKALDNYLKRMAQIKFEEVYKDEDFRKVFGKNYV